MATHQLIFAGKPSDLANYAAGEFTFSDTGAQVLGIGLVPIGATVNTDSEGEGNWNEFMAHMGKLGWVEDT